MSDVWTIERHLKAGSDHGRALFHRFVEIVAACGEYTTSVEPTALYKLNLPPFATMTFTRLGTVVPCP